MIIGYDLSSATPGRGGIGTYALELARRLVARGAGHEWVLLFNSLRQPPPSLEEYPEFGASNARIVRRRLPGPALLKAWQWADLPPIEAVLGQRVDLFHSPATYVPPQRHGARSTTVHDLWFLHPEAGRQASLGGAYLAWVARHRLPRVDLILTDAPAISRDAAAFLATLPPGNGRGPRIECAPLGVDPSFHARRPPNGPEHRSSRSPFLLHVGGHDRRKNTSTLIEAMGILHAAPRIGGQAPPPALLLAGEPPPGPLPPFIEARGRLSSDELREAYATALGLVLPSLHEGYGLPVLEALASGCPVLASDSVACLELLAPGTVAKLGADAIRDAGLLAQAISAFVADAPLRQALSQAGPGHSAPHTWERCADLTLEAFEQFR